LGPDDGKPIMYEDFFDPLPEKALEALKQKKKQKGKKKVRFAGGEEGDEEEGEEGEGDVDMPQAGEREEEQKEPEGPLSTFEKQQLEMKQKIKALEEQLVKPRSWELMGEATAISRPVDSLLEQDLDWEYAGKVPEPITAEVNKSLEDMIKQRIIDEAFDDVERKDKPDDAPKFVPKDELSTEKSEAGLAEIYEKEYMAALTGQDSAAEEKLRKEHEEITQMFSQLCLKLDSLSNFHFTPRPPRIEMSVSSNAPALALEEKVPMAVSDQQLQAPQEVEGGSFAKKKAAAGNPIARSEMSQAERKAAFKAKKRARKKAAQKRAEEKKAQEREKAAMGLVPAKPEAAAGGGQATALRKGKGGSSKTAMQATMAAAAARIKDSSKKEGKKA